MHLCTFHAFTGTAHVTPPLFKRDVSCHAHPPALVQPIRQHAPCPLTFDGDDMLPDLVLQQRLLHPLQQLVDGVDVGVHRLEALDLGADGGRVGQVLLVVHRSSRVERLGLMMLAWGEGGRRR